MTKNKPKGTFFIQWREQWFILPCLPIPIAQCPAFPVPLTPYVVFDYQKNHADEKILEAQIHMENNFTESIVLDDLASTLGFSTRHFKRRFKKATGLSPREYRDRFNRSSRRALMRA